MKKIHIALIAVALLLVGVVFLKQNAGTASFIWDVSRGGTWLLPLVLLSALLDSVHPCSFSILLITIAFLFGMEMTRKRILHIGGTYIAGIFTAYLLIGIGLLKVLHLFDTPHFMGKLGATILIVFGVLNIVNELFPSFPIKLKMPQVSRTTMGRLMERASFPAVFGLGLLVGICQFPCMGGPYLMVIGLLRDQVTYYTGFGYLVLYNFILTIPLVAVLVVSANKNVLSQVENWKKTNMRGFKFWAGIAMIIIGIVIFFI